MASDTEKFDQLLRLLQRGKMASDTEKFDKWLREADEIGYRSADELRQRNLAETDPHFSANCGIAADRRTILENAIKMISQLNALTEGEKNKLRSSIESVPVRADGDWTGYYVVPREG